MARFLTDENIPKSLTTHLRELGHDVETTAEAIRLGATDVAVIRRSRRARRFIITLDTDFIILHRQFPEPFGAVVIRTSPSTPTRVKERIDQLLANLDIEKHSNDLIVVTDTEIRVETGRLSS